MNYYLYKLKFTSAVHFGSGDSARSLDSSEMTFCADTLFSALCHIAVKAGKLDKLVECVKTDRIKFSDSMPYVGDEFYVPKPYIAGEGHIDADPSKYKKMEKLHYLPLSMLAAFFASIKGKKSFDADTVYADFGKIHVAEKVSVAGLNSTTPYMVSLFNFENVDAEDNNDCGLYGIIGYEDVDELNFVKELIQFVGIEGIGGKVSSGYGKFELYDEIWLDEPFDDDTKALNNMLYRSNASRYILLTSSLPSEKELVKVTEKSSYKLKRRAGFVNSKYVAPTVKKKTQYFFAAGSVFLQPYSGELFDVGNNLPHPVYRYSKPIFLGVDL